MKIALTYSSKEGLLQEYLRKHKESISNDEIPVDFFAEGDGPETIDAVIQALSSAGHRIKGFEASNHIAAELENYDPHLVFNMAEGLWGDFRESFVPSVCERLNIPYTGSDPLTLAVCLNKARTKEILGFHGLATPAFELFYPHEPVVLNGLGFPSIVKPVSEGSSKGIFDDSVADDPVEAVHKIAAALQKYDQPILLEKFLPGAEYTAALWGNGAEIEVLPIVSIDHSTLPAGARPIYSYEAKWIWDVPEKPLDIFKCPAQLSDDQKAQITSLLIKAYRVLNIRDWCRIDIRLDEQGKPHIIELNPLPGILPDPKDNSCFPKAARAAGYSYPEMLSRIVQITCKRHGLSS